MKNKNVVSEIATSRAISMFFCYVALSFALRLYIMPFQKHQLEINRYFQIVEYCVIGIAAVAFALAVIHFLKSRKSNADYSDKIFTPFSFLLISSSALVCSVVIPLSHNRTLALKYSFFAFIGIVVAYMIYYLLDKSLSITALICTVYCILFSYLDYMYSENVNFVDKINIPYYAFIAIFAVLIISLTFFAVFLKRKKIHIDLISVFVVSAISFLAIILRCFIIKYVSLITVIVLCVSFIILAINSKVGFLYKK